jgi:hypothetical protein
MALMRNLTKYQRLNDPFDAIQPLRAIVSLETRITSKITFWANIGVMRNMNRSFSSPPATYEGLGAAEVLFPVIGGSADTRGTGYFSAVAPALESALAHAHEAGHERAVRILHAVLAILDDPRLR